jgi:carotenoid cleavage dioxygenase-like enzyme
VNVTRVNGRSLAVSETNLAVQFEPDTLSTVGVVGYGPQASGLVTTAHPHAVPGTGDLVNYMLKFALGEADGQPVDGARLRSDGDVRRGG